MLELKPKPMAGTSQVRRLAANRQNGQSNTLLLALVVLVAAIVVLLVTDRQFWFGSNQLILDTDGTETQVAVQARPTPSPEHRAQSATATVKKHLPAATVPASNKPVPPAVDMTRSVLPPLNVEVVAGNASRAVQPGKSSKPEIANIAPGISAVTDAAGRERISSQEPAQTSYPPLAQHMNVQGSVVLKALIGADGIIEDLHVLSGPTILAAAAQQAVREWKFKPILQDGQPVETMAKIVVNFSIKVADNSEKTTLAESRAADRLLILTR